MKNSVMKKLAIPLCLSVIALIGAQSANISAKESARAATAYAFDETKIDLTFASLSDVHVGYGSNDEALSNALSLVEEYTKNGVDALYFHGDQTQNGTAEEVTAFMNVVNEHVDVTKVPTIITHGNHDTYWSGCMTTAQFAEAYGDDVYTFDVDKDMVGTGNRHVEFNGYHFLSVQIQTYMPNINNMSAETKSWLTKTLDEIVANDPDSYVFVSCHSPAKNTVYGSMDDQDTGPWGSSQELDDILKAYPQVLLFSGHTHYAINDERAINQTTYTQINAGSVSDLDSEKGYEENSSGLANRRSYSQGMLVEVDENGNVRITRIDFKQNKQIKDYWYLDAPKTDGSHLTRYSNATRAQTNTAPVFGSGAKLTVKETSETALEIVYDVATDNDMVYSYDIVVKNASGATVKTIKSLSPWYDHPDLSTLTQRKYTLGWKIQYPYTVEIVACDSFGLTSEALSVTMKDMTEEHKATAKNLDDRIAALAQKSEIEESDGEEIVKLREEINALSYKVIQYMDEYENFIAVEASYYNRFYLTEDAASYETGATDWYTMATSTKGSVADSAYTGVTLSWNSTTKNVSHGLTKAYSLDGLHLSFANLNLTSENKTYALLLSNTPKDKWLSGETFLLTVDFETGAIGVNNGSITYTSEKLLYAKLGATPFDFRFELSADGAFVWKVHTVFGEEEFTIPATALQGIPNLTDLEKCYLSFCPWASRTTGSMDVLTIHDGTNECKVYGNGELDNPSDTPSDNSSDNVSDSDGTSAGGGCQSTAANITAIAATFGVGLCLKKKKRNK